MGGQCLYREFPNQGKERMIGVVPWNQMKIVLSKEGDRVRPK